MAPKKIRSVKISRVAPIANQVGQNAEVLAQSIMDIASAMKQLNDTRLTRATLVTLISDKSGISKTTVNVVLNNLDALEANFLKRKL